MDCLYIDTDQYSVNNSISKTMCYLLTILSSSGNIVSFLFYVMALMFYNDVLVKCRK